MKSKITSILLLLCLLCLTGCNNKSINIIEPDVKVVNPYEGISDVPASKNGWSHDCEKFLTIEQSIYDDWDITLAMGTCSNCGRVLAYANGILQEDTDAIYARTRDIPMRAPSAHAAEPGPTKHICGCRRRIRIEKKTDKEIQYKAV